MGDMGDMFRGFNEMKRERKAKYQQNELPKEFELLETLPLTYQVHNRGEHYVLTIPTERGEKTVDWWPSTSYWLVRGSKTKGSRLSNLARYFKLQKKI